MLAARFYLEAGYERMKAPEVQDKLIAKNRLEKSR